MEQTNKEKLIKERFKKIFPQMKLIEKREGNDKSVERTFYSIFPDNNNFRGSRYYFKSKGKFLHFTSLLAIEAIIKSKKIRMYNINSMKDPREFSYAGNIFSFNKKNNVDAKTNLFLLSMCSDKILSSKKSEEFNMWRLYGDNGDGVCVELDFNMNPASNWRDYHLSEVYYGLKPKLELKKVNLLLKDYEDEKPKIEIDLGQLAAFHKTILYEPEKEVRLLFDGRLTKGILSREFRDSNKNISSPIIEADIAKSLKLKREVNYLELPIYHKGFQPLFDPNSIPVPKINKIILGYSYDDSFKKMKSQLMKIVKANLGHEVEIEQSRLTSVYNEAIN